MSTTTQTQTQSQPQTQAVKRFEEGTVEQVLAKIQSFQSTGELRLPPNYSPENALRSAWLILLETVDMSKRPALEVCTKESIANAMLDMVVQGLNPIKKQCYFIVYGNKLQLSKSYIGTVAIAKRVGDVKEAIGNVIYEDDLFEYEINPETGRKRIVKHVQDISNIDDNKIKGAYATVILNDGSIDIEIMTFKQIQQAWNQGAAKGNSPTHKGFAGEMAKKTVIQRALKIRIGSSDDSALFDEEEQEEDAVSTGVKHQITQHANKKELTFEAAQVIDEKPKTDKTPEAAEQSKPIQTESTNTTGPGF